MPYLLISCINLLEIPVSKYKRSEAFVTVLNWSVVAPFDFAMKQIDGSWIPAIHAYGWTGTGKSTLGDIPCYIWNTYTNEKHLQ